MSGSVSSNFAFPTYGKPTDATVLPPALHYVFDWTANFRIKPLQQPNVTFLSYTQLGVINQYQVNAGNLLRTDSRFPTIQSMFCDNTLNNVDIYVTVSGTGHSLVIPAYSFGMYPLITDSAPIISFSNAAQSVSKTIVTMFVENFTPYTTVVRKHKGNAITASTNSSAELFPLTPVPVTFLHTSTPYTLNANGVIGPGGFVPFGDPSFKSLILPVHTGALVVENVSFDLTFNYTSSSVTSVNIALVEALLSAGTWTFYTIFESYVVLDPSKGSTNGWETRGMPPIHLDPPYIGKIAFNGKQPIIVDVTANPFVFNPVPGLAWIIGSPGAALPSANIFINTYVTVSSMLTNYPGV